MDSPAAIHIQDVQSDAMAPGTAVELHGVIVTAIDTFGDKVGQDIWVQEPGGGERSGVHVFRPPTSQIANLAVGAIVDITGAIKSEFKSSSDNTGRTVTEIQAPMGGMMTVTKTGTGTVPEPHIIDVVALESMSQADRDMVYEKWEGVLIKVQNVRAFGPPGTFGTGPDAFKVQLNGDLFLESNLAMLPSAIDGTTCFASITGVEDYIGGNWTIYPRSDTEIVGGGSGCPPAMGPPVATIADIQMGVVTGTVQLRGVFVTGRELTSSGAIGRRLWLADSLQGDLFHGVLAFFPATGAGVIDPSFEVGAKLDIVGPVVEFDFTAGGDTLTEYMNPTATLVAPPGDPPMPARVTASQVGDIVTGEPFEGVLVQLVNVKVTATGSNNKVTLTDNAGDTVVMDDEAFFGYSGASTAAVPTVGTCFETLTGLMTVQTTDNARTINPRSAGDMVIGTGCN